MTHPVVHEDINNDHFESVFNFATIGILITDSSGHITEVNSFVLTEFGYTKNELLGKKVELLMPERYRNIHANYHEKYVETPALRPMGNGKNLFGLKKNGQEFPLDISLNHYHKKGKRYVVAFVSDISARKKAETDLLKFNNELESTVYKRTKDLTETLEQLEISRSELQTANLFQKALLDNAGAIIISVDKNGIIQTFNKEAEIKLGYNATEMIGKHTPLFFHDRSLIIKRTEELSEKLHNDVPIETELFFENGRKGVPNNSKWEYVRKDGTKFPIQLNVTTLRNGQGDITGFMGVAFDISETKKIEEELQHALEKEKELGELKSRFVTMASHEFRTPLSTILSSAYLVEKYPGIEEQSKRERHLERIISSVNTLTDLLNDFLSVGKIEEGKINVRLSEFNIRDFIICVVEELKDNLKKHQAICYHHEGNPLVLLDSSLLKHILMNLISNASKFSPDARAIDIKTTNTSHECMLYVKDYGIGISHNDQQHLMERFFRGANAGNIQGTGLGLHIVSKYAELMNGKVECYSELNRGTEFVITFKTKTN